MNKKNINIVVASKNKGKIEEIEYVLNHFEDDQPITFSLKTMSEVGITDDIVEDGTSFEENSLIKARYIHNRIGGIVMADDSGIMVDALDGAPGIYSARFAGENATPQECNDKLISMLKDVPYHKRGARFVCVIALILEDGSEIISEGLFDGLVAMREIGTNGFGYDPFLYLPDRKCTVAQLTAEEKNKISHRANALRNMYKQLKDKLF